MLWNVEMLRFEFWNGQIVYSYRSSSWYKELTYVLI